MKDKWLVAYVGEEEIRYVKYPYIRQLEKIDYTNFKYKGLVLFGSCGYLTHELDHRKLYFPKAIHNISYTIIKGVGNCEIFTSPYPVHNHFFRNEINAKFKDNAMKRQQEMMSLYRKAGAHKGFT